MKRLKMNKWCNFSHIGCLKNEKSLDMCIVGCIVGCMGAGLCPLVDAELSAVGCNAEINQVVKCVVVIFKIIHRSLWCGRLDCG